MKELKFRVWNAQKGYEGWLRYRHGFAINLDGVLCCPTSDKYLSPASEDFKVMQFTGLYDKDGKEIYEGDIVKLVYIHDEGGGWRSKSKERGVVYFDPTWGVKFDCKDHTQRTADTCWKIKAGRFTDATDIVVIGNIYENPELLK